MHKPLDWPTTRRHPRSLEDAFPDMRAYSGDWVRMPARNGWGGRALAVGMGVALAALLFHWWSA